MRKKQVIRNLAAFVWLMLLSAYRQANLRAASGSSFYIYVVYMGYLVLIGGWAVSLIARVTQKSFLRCLLLEAALMAMGLTGRFLQDAFFYTNVGLMRSSGLFLAATIPPIVLLGVYAAICIGQEDSFRLPGKALLLGIPVLLLCVLLIADDRLHFIFRRIAGEEEPNILFHPGAGLVILLLVLSALSILRIAIIFWKNHMMNDRPFLRLIVALAEPLILMIFLIPYLLSAMYGTTELIELFAMLYYGEAISWEFYMALGLLPVNTAWQDAFTGSTLQMQIRSTDGRMTIAASNAVALSDLQQKLLDRASTLELSDGSELHRYAIPSGAVVYRKDTALLKETLRELDGVAERLEQESSLLAEELRAANRELGIKERERIYDGLRQAVAPQLEQMERRIIRAQKDSEKTELDMPWQTQPAGEEPKSGSRTEETLRLLCILGTYVKRKCNLLLLKEEQGEMKYEDLLLSLEDLLGACQRAGIPVSQEEEAESGVGRPSGYPSAAGYAGPVAHAPRKLLLALFETVEALLELHDFAVCRMKLYETEGQVILQVYPKANRTPEEIRAAACGCRAAYRDCGQQPGAYEVILMDETDTAAGHPPGNADAKTTEQTAPAGTHQPEGGAYV